MFAPVFRETRMTGLISETSYINNHLGSRTERVGWGVVRAKSCDAE